MPIWRYLGLPVAVWRCKLRLKATNLTDAYVVVGGNPVPALDLVHEQDNDSIGHRENGIAATISNGAITGGRRPGPHRHQRDTVSQTAAGIIEGHGMDVRWRCGGEVVAMRWR